MTSLHFKKKSFIESVTWLITLLIAIVILAPVMYKISYSFLIFNILQIMVILTYFRWIVNFDDVLLFHNTWIKMISIPILLVSSFILVHTGQHIILVLENQNLPDIITNPNQTPSLTQSELYHLYNYLHILLIFTTWVSGGISIILAIRIIASYIGYKSQKLKNYLEIRH